MLKSFSRSLAKYTQVYWPCSKIVARVTASSPRASAAAASELSHVSDQASLPCESAVVECRGYVQYLCSPFSSAQLEPVPTSAPVLLSSPRSLLCKLRKENYAQVRTGKYARVHEAVTSTRRLCHLTRPLGTSLLPQVPCWN